jgi:hypothetical protein
MRTDIEDNSTQRVRHRRGRIKLRTALVSAAGVVAAAALFVSPAAAAVSAPTVTTGAATNVTYSSATLTGAVNPRGLSTLVYFQIGTTNKFGAQSAPQEIPAGGMAVPVAISFPGLTAGTTYHYRIVATNSSGTTLGADRTLTTPKIPLSLAIAATPSPVPFEGFVTVEGTLSGTGSAGAPVQLQQALFPYTAGFVDVGNPELTLANGAFSFIVSMTLTSEFRVVSGTTVSPIVTTGVSLGVTLTAHATMKHHHPAIHFAGTIAPAEPGARIAFERLVGTNWKVVGGTVAGITPVNGTVTYAATVRVHQAGFFRALVLPVEGAHVAGYSATTIINKL